jgi:hypothetical protein
MDMSFIVAAFALLLALSVSIVLDYTSLGKSREVPRGIPSFDAW